MPRRTDIYERADGLFAAAERILLLQGPGKLSFRALARARNMSLGSLADHYESRRRLFHLLCEIASDEWVKDLRASVAQEGVLGFLPADEEGIDRARVWASWVEMSRSDPELRGTVGDVRLEERAVLADALDLDDVDLLDLWLAAIDGLRHRVVAPLDALSPQRARHLLVQSLPVARGAACQVPGLVRARLA